MKDKKEESHRARGAKLKLMKIRAAHKAVMSGKLTENAIPTRTHAGASITPIKVTTTAQGTVSVKGGKAKSNTAKSTRQGMVDYQNKLKLLRSLIYLTIELDQTVILFKTTVNKTTRKGLSKEILKAVEVLTKAGTKVPTDILSTVQAITI